MFFRMNVVFSASLSAQGSFGFGFFPVGGAAVKPSLQILTRKRWSSFRMGLLLPAPLLTPLPFDGRVENAELGSA